MGPPPTRRMVPGQDLIRDILVVMRYLGGGPFLLIIIHPLHYPSIWGGDLFSSIMVIPYAIPPLWRGLISSLLFIPYTILQVGGGPISIVFLLSMGDRDMIWCKLLPFIKLHRKLKRKLQFILWVCEHTNSNDFFCCAWQRLEKPKILNETYLEQII